MCVIASRSQQTFFYIFLCHTCERQINKVNPQLVYHYSSVFFSTMSEVHAVNFVNAGLISKNL